MESPCSSSSSLGQKIRWDWELAGKILVQGTGRLLCPEVLDASLALGDCHEASDRVSAAGVLPGKPHSATADHGTPSSLPVVLRSLPTGLSRGLKYS